MNLFPDKPSRLSDDELAARVAAYFSGMERLRQSAIENATHEVVCRGKAECHFSLEEANQAAEKMAERDYADAVVYQIHPRKTVSVYRWSGGEAGIRVVR